MAGQEAIASRFCHSSRSCPDAYLQWKHRHSDATNEPRCQTAVPSVPIVVGALGPFIVRRVIPTMFLLSLVPIGANCFKGPF